MDADKWLMLPCDLLVDIFRRLELSAIIRCAGVYRPWRHAIIDNASCLRPCPDRFLPKLLLGFLESRLGSSRPYLPWKLHYVQASNTAAVPNFLPPATGVCVDGKFYSHLLSSRDGFLLLGDGNGTADSLCLFNAHTGISRVLPAAEFDHCTMVRSMYVLATGDDETAVRILAVRWQRESSPDGRRHGIVYQIFSSASGAWGPVKCSAKFPERDDLVVVTGIRGPSSSVVVCHGAVSWFVHLVRNRRIRMCIFSIDMRTERTWATELPKPDLACAAVGPSSSSSSSVVLAVSDDGRRLSLVRMVSSSHRMEVWELVGDGDDGRWTTLRPTIDDVQKLLPNCPRMIEMRLLGFCPRSGFLFGTGKEYQNLHHHFVIGVDGSSPRLIGSGDSSCCASRLPDEMDSSTYISSCISKMKYF